MHAATVRLSAPGEPLREPRVRATVIAAARALAERTGLEILDVRAEDAGIELTLHAEEATAVGFAAELRRITNAWHHARSGESLWPGRTDRDGDLRDDDADDASF